MAADWTFDKATARRDALDAEVSRLGAIIKAFPKTGPMGLTPDTVKVSPEYRAARLAYDKAFAALREFNGAYTKLFSAEIKAARRARRAA